MDGARLLPFASWPSEPVHVTLNWPLAGLEVVFENLTRTGRGARSRPGPGAVSFASRAASDSSAASNTTLTPDRTPTHPAGVAGCVSFGGQGAFEGTKNSTGKKKGRPHGTGHTAGTGRTGSGLSERGSGGFVRVYRRYHAWRAPFPLWARIVCRILFWAVIATATYVAIGESVRSHPHRRSPSRVPRARLEQATRRRHRLERRPDGRAAAQDHRARISGFPPDNRRDRPAARRDRGEHTDADALVAKSA